MRKHCAASGMVFLLSVSLLFAQTEPPPVEGPTVEVGTEEIMESTPFDPVRQQKPVDIRKLPPGKVAELKESEAYWYANAEPQKQARKEKRRSSGGGQIGGALWIFILVVFAGAVIWYLASSNVNLFRKPSRKIDEEVAEEELSDDIFSINYEKEISKAAAAGNYRLAIRLWYWSTLKELADRGIIQYRHEKTNSDYVNSLYGSNYYRDFFRLTRNFEYTWYGQFDLSPEAYRLMQTDFSTFKAGLHR